LMEEGRRVKERGASGRRSVLVSAGALDTAARGAGARRLYFCVIDRLSYENLETALAHVKIQHGLDARGELLVRSRLLGGAL
jgi:hypothetical protein